MTYANDYCKTVETYYGELKKCPPISREEEERLFKLVKQDDLEARNKILTSNLQFVVDVAKGYKGYGVSMPDLISEGNMGLTKAIERFDPDRGVKFISYAVWWVRQYIQDSIKKRNNTTSVEVDIDDINKNDADNYTDTEDDPESNNVDILVDESQEEDRNQEAVSHLLGVLNDRERNIITMYYGLGKSESTLDEIGAGLGLSKERVRQIKASAIRKMRSEALMDNNLF